MKKVIALIAVFLIGAVLAEITEDELESQFSHYMKKYNKQYHQADVPHRYNNWKARWFKIHKVGSSSSNAVHMLPSSE